MLSNFLYLSEKIYVPKYQKQLSIKKSENFSNKWALHWINNVFFKVLKVNFLQLSDNSILNLEKLCCTFVGETGAYS